MTDPRYGQHVQKYYALTTYKNGKQVNFWDFYETLDQVRRDAKQCLKDGIHERIISKETNGLIRWAQIEHIGYDPLRGKLFPPTPTKE